MILWLFFVVVVVVCLFLFLCVVVVALLTGCWRVPVLPNVRLITELHKNKRTSAVNGNTGNWIFFEPATQ